MSVPANFNGQTSEIDPTNAATLLIDHQSSLFQMVKDMPMTELCANATTLAKVVTLVKIPVIITASVPQGPNGPLIPEIRGAAPHAQYAACKGEINAWDSSEFVAAMKTAGKKQLIVAGTITDVRVAFPSIAAVYDDYQAFTAIDASGTYSKMIQGVTLARVVQAGVVPTDTAVVCSEIQCTWNRDDAVQLAETYSVVLPHHQLLIKSYAKVQVVVNNHERLDSQRK